MPRWKQKQNQDRFKEDKMSTEEIFGAVSGGIGALSGLASFGMGYIYINGVIKKLTFHKWIDG